LELIHVNVWGKASVPSLGGSLYFAIFIDNASRNVWIYFLKQKLKVFYVLKKWLAQVKNGTGLKLKCLKPDNKGEYFDSRFEEFCVNRGIKRVKMISGNPHQNGIAVS